MKNKTPKTKPVVSPTKPTVSHTKSAATRLTQGERVRATVTEWSADGVALATSPGGPLRVVGGVPGDVGDVRILAVGQHQTWAVSDPDVIETPSEDRVIPRCPVVLRCGGCPWQMVSTERQRALRRASLTARLGEVVSDATWHPLVEAPEHLGYRTRATMVVRHMGGRLRAGFYEPKSQQLVAAEACDVQHPVLNSIIRFALKQLTEANLPTWRSEERPGLVRALVVRIDPDREKALLSVVVSADDPRLLALGEAFMRIDGVVGASAIINDRPSGPLASGQVIQLGGAAHLIMRAGAFKVPVGPLAFTQTHAGVARKMVEAVAGLLPERSAHLVDLYAGVGVFGLSFADRADRVTLVERGSEAVAAARAAIGDNDAITIVEGDATKVAAEVIGAGTDTTVIVDPPRSGCKPAVLEAIRTSAVQTVIYVSCGPKALARDLALLEGFAVTDVVEVEMFPHTPHEEVILKLTRTKPPTP